MRASREMTPYSDNILLCYKNVGETMGELVRRVRREHSLTNDEKITFVGRLDPLASGLVLFLRGAGIEQRDSFLLLDKVYTFDVVCGVQTDSGDVLGVIEKTNTVRPLYEEIASAGEQLQGTQTFPYPAYSSKTVDSKPLFQHAREGTLSSITIPTKDVTIHALQCTGCREESPKNFIEQTVEKIGSVNDDFRQEEIVGSWKSSIAHNDTPFLVCSFQAHVSSGTYIRTLAEHIAHIAGTVGIANNITRTHVGSYSLDANNVNKQFTN